jgi:thioester reductase-like protein
MADAAGTTLVTGYPGFIGRRLVHRMLEQGLPERLVLLVQHAHAAAARAEVARHAPPGRVEVWEGDVSAMHLGLSGAEWRSLVRDVGTVWHLAAASRLDSASEVARRVNVEGTRNVLELARAAARPTRLHHFSSAFVSGDRRGVIMEDELMVGQRFRTTYEQSKARAEELVRRAMGDVPTTIYRPAIVVGDSRTGEIDRFEGPYYLAILLVTSPLAVPLPLPGEGGAPLNVVPVDFVVEAALTIARNPASVGKTVHVVDLAPLSARRVYEMIAERAHRRMPRVSLPHKVVDAVLSLPVLERFSRQQRAAIESVNQLAFYNPRNLIELLEGTGVRCPPVTAYLDRLIDFVRDHFEKREATRPVADEDPLAAAATPREGEP